MEDKKTTPQYSLIAGILFGILALSCLRGCNQLLYILYVIIFAALAVLFIMKKGGVPTTAVLGGLALVELLEFIRLFKSYTVYVDWYWEEERFSLFVMLLYLLVALAYVGLFCIAAANYTTWLDKYKQTINRL